MVALSNADVKVVGLSDKSKGREAVYSFVQLQEVIRNIFLTPFPTP